jgi:hypothetical protein
LIRRVGGGPKEAEGMIKAKDRHTVSARCTGNGNQTVEIQATMVEGVCQVDRVGMKRGNQVSVRREILGSAGMQEHPDQNRKKQQPHHATAAPCDFGQNSQSSEWGENPNYCSRYCPDCEL